MAAQIPTTYKIIGKETHPDFPEFIFTIVVYNINGYEKTVKIPHQMPDSLYSIISDIETRQISEERIKEASNKNLLIFDEIMVEQALQDKVEN